jgi:probable FeS assembly SUF system protein SufT
MGGLFRVDGLDADALGQILHAPDDTTSSDRPLQERVWDQLKSCYDPEIPVNIVDLGLIYGMELLPTDDGLKACVQMTLTAPGCGMGPAIAADAKRKIEALSEISEATVDVVWDPPWGPERISPAGRKHLGMDP